MSDEPVSIPDETLKRIKTMASNLGDDPSPESKANILREWTGSLDGADPLRIKLERDALVLLPEFSAGAVDAALSTHRSISAVEPDEDAEPSPEQLETWYREGREILEAEDQLVLLCAQLGQVGYAGDSVPLELVYVALHSRNLERPIGLALIGPSAAGKTFTVQTARRFHPPDAVEGLEGFSERLLAYADFPTKHRYVFIAEASALHREGIGASIIRGLAWGQGIRYGTVMSTDAGPQAVIIEKPGPTGLITTATKPLQEEIATRLISLPITDSPVQTKAVVHELAREAAGERLDDADLSDWIATSRFLQYAGEKRVVIPFATKLAESVPTKDVRMRRDFEQLLSLIRAHAFAHQIRRERDGEGRILAHALDYANGHRLASRVLEVTLTAVTSEVRKAVEKVAELNEARAGYAEVGVSFTKLGAELELTPEGARYRAKQAMQKDWLINSEDRRGYPARLVVGDPLPEDKPVLPTVQELFGDVLPTTPPIRPWNLGTPELTR